MADSKLTGLSAVTTVSADDLVYVVDDPGGAPVSKKITVANFRAAISTPATNGFRLTLSSGNPAYNPLRATPSSTDTGTEQVTFSSSTGWTNGTIVTVSATGGNLTAGTRYYLHAVTGSTVFTFHTNVADAISGGSPVNLSASITAVVIPSGISNTTIYFTPYSGALISLYNGATWDELDSAEVSLALGTLTADKNYDVFAYNNSGTLTLELSAAWASDSARTDAIVRQNGVWVKSGAATRRLVGTIRTDSTTTTTDNAGGIESLVVTKRWVVNIDNIVQRPATLIATNDTVAPGTTSAWEGFNSSSTAGISVLSPLEDRYIVTARATLSGFQNSGTGSREATGIGIDSTSTNSAQLVGHIYAAVATQANSVSAFYQGFPGLGERQLNWLTYTTNSGTTWLGDDGLPAFCQTGLQAMVWA